MKFPRFTGGLTLGISLGFAVSSMPVNKVSLGRKLEKYLLYAWGSEPETERKERIRLHASYFPPEPTLIFSLREQKSQKDMELSRLRDALRHKIQQEVTYDSNVDVKKAKEMERVLLLKWKLEQQDNEIRWLKGQVGEVDQLDIDEF